MGRAGSSNLKKNREVQNNQKIQAHLLWGSTLQTLLDTACRLLHGHSARIMIDLLSMERKAATYADLKIQ
jgi:hypothetical protein